MPNKSIISQINSAVIYDMHFKQFYSLASNVWILDNLPSYIDLSYVNNILLEKGAIAFFIDDILKQICAMPFRVIGNLDNQNNPIKIQVYNDNINFTRILNSNDFVIMYDNTMKISLFNSLILYAKKYTVYDRIQDINVIQQKTSRIYKIPQEKETSFRKIINDIDSNVYSIYTYENIEIEDIDVIMKPAEFVADKIQIQKENIKNEFLNMIGITNLNIQKKERLITDEVQASLGGAIANRYNRFTPRKQAVDLINERFKDYLDKPIVVKYFDEIPTSSEKQESIEESEVDTDVNIQ